MLDQRGFGGLEGWRRPGSGRYIVARIAPPGRPLEALIVERRSVLTRV